ncbi:MAG TPA: sugar transferase [Chthoniobacterales bacterium]|nr:sugar transferase [Chthoniobacterales bacterium]
MGNSNLKISTAREQALSVTGRKVLARIGHVPAGREEILAETTFHALLTHERRRAERSRKPFVLMLLELHALHAKSVGASFSEQVSSAISGASRETDLIGWYEEGRILAVIFAELNVEENVPVAEFLRSKIETVLRDSVGTKAAARIVITTHIFPESWSQNGTERPADLKLYPDLSEKRSKKRLPIVVKRGIDVLGSALLLLTLSPILAAIALAIKLTSKGPMIFEQERLGQFGTKFKCLKFRTMYTNNDPKIHREYVQGFIAGRSKDADLNGSEPVVYKLTNDPRVTTVGRFLRKTSLDEFPQFWNVLRGEMSLVGPRPPVPYEFEMYDFWHRRRVFELKPGVTGLWQVNGRSRTCFDDMVRLDLRYSQTWSLWLDLKILLATPLAVVAGNGAH